MAVDPLRAGGHQLVPMRWLTAIVVAVLALAGCSGGLRVAGRERGGADAATYVEIFNEPAHPGTRAVRPSCSPTTSGYGFADVDLGPRYFGAGDHTVSFTMTGVTRGTSIDVDYFTLDD
jgi:hypothetical protein